MCLVKKVRDWLKQNVQWETDCKCGHEAEREWECERRKERQPVSSSSGSTRLSTRPGTRLSCRSSGQHSSDQHSSGEHSSHQYPTESRHYHYEVHNYNQSLHVHVPPERSIDGRSRSMTSTSTTRVASESYTRDFIVLDRHTVETYVAERPRATTIQAGRYQRAPHSSNLRQGAFVNHTIEEPYYPCSYQCYSRSRGDQLLRADTRYNFPEGWSSRMEYQEEEDWSSSWNEESDRSPTQVYYITD